MTEQEYNQHEGIRRSDLWKIRESPEKYLWAIGHPEEPTPALVFGSMVHKLLLQPKEFADEYAVAPEADRRTKESKEAYQAFITENARKTIVSANDMLAAMGMVSAVERHPIASKLLHGEAEKPIFWTDEDTGELLKCRLDMLTEIGGKTVVVDYKTALNADTRTFTNKMFQLGYHLQAYMYTEAVMREYKLEERPPFIFVVQEKTPPYAVNCIAVPENVILSGMDCFRELIGILHECLETGVYWGYNGKDNDLNEAFLPKWIGGETSE
jgi:ATP-dependent exoDNAse (exonuclease V) beta subunit